MNWLYLIPVAAIAAMLFVQPLQTVAAVALVVGVCFGGVWLLSKIMRP